MALTIHVAIDAQQRATDADVAAAIAPAMRSLMAAMLGRAKRLVPKKTWALHDSLATEVIVEGGTVVGILAAGKDYARHVELGTSRQRAQPYLRPAMLQSKAADLRGRG